MDIEKLKLLQEGLKKEFYIDNLYEMARLCRNLELGTTNPAPFFVMEQIFSDIARHWEDRPLPVEKAALVKSKLIKPFEDLIKGIATNSISSEEMLSLINGVVSTYSVSLRVSDIID